MYTNPSHKCIITDGAFIGNEIMITTFVSPFTPIVKVTSASSLNRPLMQVIWSTPVSQYTMNGQL